MDRQTLHSHLSFEVLAKLFFTFTEERYPAAEKFKQAAARLVAPLSKDPLVSTHLKIGVLTVMRNLVKEVAPTQLYRTLQHRDDLYLAIIEALEDLEDEVEELEEEREEESQF
jgi:hypothetical protein